MRANFAAKRGIQTTPATTVLLAIAALTAIPLLVAVTVLLVATTRTAAAAPAVDQEMSLRLELFVDDVERSAAFYTSVLGFSRQSGDASYLPVTRGTVTLGLGPAAGLGARHYFNPELSTARRGLGVELVLEVDDVEACFQHVQQTAPKTILTPVGRRSWGLTDFRVADPDGYYLRITSR